MNLLMVSACLPGLASGASARNYHLLKALSRQHTIALLILADSAEVEAYSEMSMVEALACSVRLITRDFSRSKRWQQLLSVVHGSSYFLHLFALKEMQAALDTMLARDQYDAVLFESVLVAGYRLPAGMKVLIDQHNIEHELLGRTYEHEKAWLRKWYNRYEYRLVKQAEIERCHKADLVLVTSE